MPDEHRDDDLKWPFERGGKVTARSAYHFIRSQENNSENGEEAVEEASLKHIWTAIWKVRMLSKIKLFDWKLAAKALAVTESMS